MEITRICVLGSGIMGRQITQVAAVNGFEVNYISAPATRETVAAGLTGIRDNLQRFSVDKGKMTGAEMDAVRARIHLHTDLAAAAKVCSWSARTSKKTSPTNSRSSRNWAPSAHRKRYWPATVPASW